MYFLIIFIIIFKDYSEFLSLVFVIITDVNTRWNSTLFLIRSISEMKPALHSLKEGRFEDTDKTDKNLKQKIPSAKTFEIIESIIPIMEKVLLLSEVMSGDDKPTLYQVIPRYGSAVLEVQKSPVKETPWQVGRTFSNFLSMAALTLRYSRGIMFLKQNKQI